MTQDNLVRTIQSAITDEVFYALGLKRRGFLHRGLGWLFSPPTRIFARYMGEVERAVEAGALPAGARKMLDMLGIHVQAQGVVHIPQAGPTIILSNHPGAYDSIAIGSLVPGMDLKIIVGETRFYKALPNISPHLICVSPDPHRRREVLTQTLDHLQAGGCLIQFGSGLIEPDPMLEPVGAEVFEKWSPSIEIFLRKAPETRIVPTIASGVLLKRFHNHPLTWLRRGDMDKRRLAEFSQVIQQLLFPKTVHAEPRISFGAPFTLADLETDGAGKRLMPAVIACMQAQLESHLTWTGQQPG